MEASIVEIVTPSAPTFIVDLQKQHDHQYLFHLFIRLGPEFEALCGSILHLHPLSSITEAISEFIAEEMCLRML